MTSTLMATRWPYWSFHREDRAIKALLRAIDSGELEPVRSGAATVNRFRGGEGAIGRVSFLAMNGQNDHVRLAALEAMKVIPAASEAPVVRPMLSEIRKRESNGHVRD